jgi:hypothetical protein
MLAPFENAAFAMSEGDLVGPVKTEVGYHIIKCTEHAAPFVQPLKLVYSIVASDLAKLMADTVAQRRADSLVRVVHTPEQAQAAARALNFEIASYAWGDDEVNYNPLLDAYYARLLKLGPGEMMGFKQQAKGVGYWVTWVDSISAPIAPQWDAARESAIQAYREGAGERAMMAKVTELDSLAAAGWSFDSLGTLWGGLQRSKEYQAPGPGQRVNLPVALDSLVFGTHGRPAVLAPGQTSGWVRWTGGMARVRLAERREPPPDRLRARMEELQRIEVERSLEGYFDGLKKRYPVRIADRALAAIPLPEMPPAE